MSLLDKTPSEDVPTYRQRLLAAVETEAAETRKRADTVRTLLAEHEASERKLSSARQGLAYQQNRYNEAVARLHEATPTVKPVVAASKDDA